MHIMRHSLFEIGGGEGGTPPGPLASWRPSPSLRSAQKAACPIPVTVIKPRVCIHLTVIFALVTASELKRTLSILGWRGSHLSRRLGVHANSVSAWMTGKTPVPTYVEEYLRVVRLLHEALGR